ncbi:MAG: glycosyltransferase family 2 protein [Deltaproteobacteria bacterium]|nr:glycosyltransferase family 2 protein [Deltaproteobacteria bacterium]
MEQPKSRVLVIIPAYNEEQTIGGVIADVKKEMPSAHILVVNDGSTDATARIVREFAGGGGVGLISHAYNLGIGATMQTGFRYALKKGYGIAVQVDADGQHPAGEIKKLVKPVEEKRADVAVGSRFLGLGEYRPSFSRGIAIGIFSSVVSLVLRKRFTDPTSGFRAAGGGAVRFLSGRYPDDYPEAEALVLLSRKGFAIMEVPVRMAGRKGGRSSITAGKGIYYMIKVLLAIFVDLLKKAD